MPWPNRPLCNILIKTNEAEMLIKHISCDFMCKFDSTACNSNQKWNNDKC